MDYSSKEVKGIKVNYVDQGSGCPVFFIPPWGSSSLAFEGLSRMIAKDNVRTIRLDLPGWGKMSKERLPKKDFDSYVDLVSDFINSFGFKSYATLGYSLGATFILSGIARGLIHPQKNIVVSGFHSRRNIFEVESRLKRNVELYGRTRNSKIPIQLFKSVVKIFYLFDMVTNRVYFTQAPYYMRLIFSDAMNGDMESAMTPIFTLRDHSEEDFKNYKGKSLVVYSANEPWYYKQFTDEIAQMFNVEPVSVDAQSHRHLSFEPDKSYNVIRDFILNK